MPQIDGIRSGAVQYRSAVVEDVDAQKGVVRLKAVPYSLPTDIGANIIEEFKPAAFERSVKSPHRLSMWSGHGGPVIGRGIEAEDKADGVWMTLKVGRTQAAQDAILNLEDGIQSDPSIEFRPLPDWLRVEQRQGGGLSVVHRRAHLLGVALVTDGAYHGSAFVESVRDAQAEREREAFRLWFAEYRSRELG